MKCLFPRPSFIFTSQIFFPNSSSRNHHQTLVRISHFSTYSSPNPSYPSRRHEEESRNVRVSVWWDFENCTLPAGANVFKVAQSITAAIRANGIKGPIQVTAFGDVMQLSRANQEALSSTGINLTHIPNGGKNSADRSLLVDLMYWVTQNPPPAHLFLISGDRDFSGILHRLRMSNYNILLASPESAPGVLCSAASIMWQWNALVRGENLNGKHFNQPPDGPYGSWYGHFKAPLEDPFAVTEQPVCLRAELSDSGSDAKLRPIPKAVMKQIRHVLYSYPKGLSIVELRSELAKSNVSIDKDLYGYKKFSRFLLAMPHILKLHSGAEGQLVVSCVTPKVPEQVDSTPGLTTQPINTNGDKHLTMTRKSNGEDMSSTRNVDEKSSQPLPSEPNVEALPTKCTESTTKVQEPIARVQEPPTKLQDPLRLVEVINNAKATECHLHPVEQHDSRSEVGFFKWVWRKCFGGKDGGSEQKSCSKPEECSTRKIKTEEKCVKSEIQSAESVSMASFSSASSDAVKGDKIAGGSEDNDEKSSRGPSFLNQITSWCKFWKSTPDSDNSGEQVSEEVDFRKHEIFSKESFWSEMEAFMDTPQGSEVVLQSRNRIQMAKSLRKQGPCVLRSFSESDLLYLVELLISDKKWVEECSSIACPFKLIQPAGKSSSGSMHGSNGLRSIFLSTPSQPSSRHAGGKRHQNGVSPPVSEKEPSGKSRNEILCDCQKLVNDILKEYPEGFNMGSFRKLFLETYGYSLDVQKLGYQKLATLIQIMPGVKIESTYIVPSPKAYRAEQCDVSRKDDDSDSPWDELGPISMKNETELASSRKAKKGTMGSIHRDYEPLSDDISDSEEESLSLTESEGQGKPRMNEEDSSLLQILDSWYSSKEDNNRRDDGVVDCSRNGLKPSRAGTRTEAPAINNGRKQRPSKSYSFVSERHGDNKNELIDGILGNLKKSGERSAESRI